MRRSPPAPGAVGRFTGGAAGAYDAHAVRALAYAASTVALCALIAAACQGDPVGSAGGAAGGGQGGAGGCPTAPHAAFELTITAADGTVPADTAIEVAWSVGKQGFELDDRSTWLSLVDGNVVCDVDTSVDAAPPKALATLVCQLWTTGPTRVTVTAKGYAPIEQTLAPKRSDRCDVVLTGQVALVLRRPAPDAGSE